MGLVSVCVHVCARLHLLLLCLGVSTVLCILLHLRGKYCIFFTRLELFENFRFHKMGNSYLSCTTVGLLINSRSTSSHNLSLYEGLWCYFKHKKNHARDSSGGWFDVPHNYTSRIMPPVLCVSVYVCKEHQLVSGH